MKRWAIIVLNLILCLSVNKVFAYDDVEIYDEDFENPTGSITIDFISRTNLEDENSYSSQVGGAKIELYHMNSGTLEKVGSYVSNSNDQVVIDNLPFGLYKYKIVEVPDGIVIDDTLKTVELTIMDEDIVIKDYLKIEVILSDVDDTITKVDEESSVTTIDEDTTNEVITETKVQDKEVTDEMLTTSKVNTLATSIYNTTTTTSSKEVKSVIDTSSNNVEEEEIKSIAKRIKSESKKKDMKKDIISAMKNVKITDTIREAVVTNNNDKYKVHVDVADLDHDKFKKKFRKIITTQKIAMKYRAYKNNVYANITRAIRIV